CGECKRVPEIFKPNREMTNDEARMTKERPKFEMMKQVCLCGLGSWPSCLVFRHSFVIRASSFVIISLGMQRRRALAFWRLSKLKFVWRRRTLWSGVVLGIFLLQNLARVRGGNGRGIGGIVVVVHVHFQCSGT